MKNFLLYFYNINIENINEENDKYSFIYNGNQYVLEIVNDTNKNIYYLSQLIIQSGIKCNEIILNRFNEPITQYENQYYVLMKTFENYNKKITFLDVLEYPIKSAYLEIEKNNNWQELWSKKVDYLTYQINQFGLNYPLLRESFGYFSGICENAIQILNYVNNNDLYIVHKRMNLDTTYYDLYNPFNMILDTRVRDVAEYLKSLFINDDNIYDKTNYFFNNLNLSNNEKDLFIIRMMYPTFYFDLYEKVLEKKEDEKSIQKIIDKTNSYEEYLSYIMNYLSNVNLKIEWLKK